MRERNGGDAVEIHGKSGVIKSFTPIMTILESDGERTVISNGVFLGDVVKQ